MREMKPSSMEWIGNIPLSWKVMPNKYLMRKKKEICPVYNGEDILSLTMKGIIVRDLDAGGKMPASFDGYQRLEPGNLLMCLFDIDVTPRCIGLIKQAGLSSPAYSQFVLSDGADAAYYCYYYTMLDNDKTLLHLAKNLRHSLTEDQLGAIPVIVPPTDEQRRIADFLDTKCAEIDALTTDIQTQIDTLEQYKRSVITETVTKGLNPDAEMRDSGIQWIGDMPAHWGVIRGKYILRYMQKPVRESLSEAIAVRTDLQCPTRKSDIKASMLATWLFTVWTALLVLSASLIHAVRLLRCSMCWIPINASDTSCIIFAVWLTAMCSLLWRPAFVCAPVTFGGTSWQSFPIRYRRWMSRMPS